MSMNCLRHKHYVSELVSACLYNVGFSRPRTLSYLWWPGLWASLGSSVLSCDFPGDLVGWDISGVGWGCSWNGPERLWPQVVLCSLSLAGACGVFLGFGLFLRSCRGSGGPGLGDAMTVLGQFRALLASPWPS